MVFCPFISVWPCCGVLFHTINGMELWEPKPADWENISRETIENHKNYCRKFVANFPNASEDFEYFKAFNQFRERKISLFIYDCNRFEDAGVGEMETK